MPRRAIWTTFVVSENKEILPILGKGFTLLIIEFDCIKSWTPKVGFSDYNKSMIKYVMSVVFFISRE